MEGRENPAGRLDPENEHRIGFMDALDDPAKGLAARQAISVLDGLDLATHGAVERVVLVGFGAKGGNPVGDQP